MPTYSSTDDGRYWDDGKSKGACKRGKAAGFPSCVHLNFPVMFHQAFRRRRIPARSTAQFARQRSSSPCGRFTQQFDSFGQ